MNLLISDLITPKHQQLLWKDECGDEFLLMKYGTIWIYDKNTLGLNIFVRDVCRRMMSHGQIFAHNVLDDGFDECFAKVEKLPDLLAQDSRRIRMKRNSKMHYNLEQRLGHKILPHRPNKLTGR